jgi:hypothetical protein
MSSSTTDYHEYLECMIAPELTDVSEWGGHDASVDPLLANIMSAIKGVPLPVVRSDELYQEEEEFELEEDSYVWVVTIGDLNYTPAYHPASPLDVRVHKSRKDATDAIVVAIRGGSSPECYATAGFSIPDDNSDVFGINGGRYYSALRKPVLLAPAPEVWATAGRIDDSVMDGGVAAHTPTHHPRSIDDSVMEDVALAYVESAGGLQDYYDSL